MSIGDIFNKNKLQQLEAENLELKKQVEELSAKFTPELQELIDISESIKQLNDQTNELNSDINNKKQTISDLQLQITSYLTCVFVAIFIFAWVAYIKCCFVT